MTATPIQPPDLPAPKGHYSPGLGHGDLVFVSGQLPLDPDTGTVVSPDIMAQTHRALDQVASILTAGGSDLSQVLQLTIYLTDLAHWGAVNAVCAERFGDHRPTRAIVPCGPLHFGALVEITAIGGRREVGGDRR